MALSSSSSSSCDGFLHPLSLTFHQVKLRDHGSELIEVSDNGSGVKPPDFQALTLKYHTSKIQGFDDLTSLTSYGFRGEALSSLCALCEKLTVVTRAEGEEVGSRVEFDPQGALVSTTPCARAQGTTVAVKGLFKPLPVRHKVNTNKGLVLCDQRGLIAYDSLCLHLADSTSCQEFCRHLKREYHKALSLVQSYALINTRVRILVTHQPGSNKQDAHGSKASTFSSSSSSSSSSSVVLATSGGETCSLKDTIVSVLGTRLDIHISTTLMTLVYQPP
jgi:DNA mismatch repair ATPase MutL